MNVPVSTKSVCNDFPLRLDYLAQVVVPRDMTAQEAERLCEFIRSLAQPTTQFGDPVMDIDDENLNLHLTNTGSLVYIHAKGWIDVATAKRILAWLSHKIPADAVKKGGSYFGDTLTVSGDRDGQAAVKEQSEAVRDMFDPGWREREAEHVNKFANIITPAKPKQTDLVPYCERCGISHPADMGHPAGSALQTTERT